MSERKEGQLNRADAPAMEIFRTVTLLAFLTDQVRPTASEVAFAVHSFCRAAVADRLLLSDGRPYFFHHLIWWQMCIAPSIRNVLIRLALGNMIYAATDLFL